MLTELIKEGDALFREMFMIAKEINPGKAKEIMVKKIMIMEKRNKLLKYFLEKFHFGHKP